MSNIMTSSLWSPNKPFVEVLEKGILLNKIPHVTIQQLYTPTKVEKVEKHNSCIKYANLRINCNSAL